MNGSDDELDISALDAFCHLIKNEPDLSAAATRSLAGKIQSLNVKESLLALEALEGNHDQIFNSQFNEPAHDSFSLILQNAWTHLVLTSKSR